jgi:acetyl-CoA C-acetyltransferase
MIGWAHSRFGKLDNIDLEQLVVDVSREAMRDAQVRARDIDAVVIGHCGGGMVPEIFVSSLPLQADAELRFKPAMRVENACATGTAAIHAGLDMIAAGRAKRVLVVGAEKMTGVPGAKVTEILASASYVKEESAHGLTFPGIFALFAQRYFEKFGDHSATLAKIAAKNHANGVRNPLAQMQRDLGFEFCNTVSDRNPIVAAPLRKTDCSLVSDGAAAIILADRDIARSAPKAVAFRARTHVNDFLPMSRRDPLLFEGAREAITQAYRAAGISVDDLDFAEVHDCFTMAELLIYEAMGLAQPGHGARVIDEGISAANGKLPINPSGGLKSKGHPIGATGVSMHVLAARQLVGDAGDFQVRNAGLGLVFNMGGSAVANYASILEPLR